MLGPNELTPSQAELRAIKCITRFFQEIQEAKTLEIVQHFLQTTTLAPLQVPNIR